MRFEEFKNLILMLMYYNPENPITFLIEIYASHETDDEYFVLYEDCSDHSLEKIMRAMPSGYEESSVVEILYEVMRALEVFKTFNFYHGGIFPLNLYEINGVIKIGIPHFKPIQGKVVLRGRFMGYNAPDL
jgi:serine/threonine protein kinase